MQVKLRAEYDNVYIGNILRNFRKRLFVSSVMTLFDYPENCCSKYGRNVGRTLPTNMTSKLLR